MNTPLGNPISNYSLGSAWLTAKVGGTVNKLITELHYAGGDFCAYKPTSRTGSQKHCAALLHYGVLAYLLYSWG